MRETYGLVFLIVDAFFFVTLAYITAVGRVLFSLIQ